MSTQRDHSKWFAVIDPLFELLETQKDGNSLVKHDKHGWGFRETLNVCLAELIGTCKGSEGAGIKECGRAHIGSCVPHKESFLAALVDRGHVARDEGGEYAVGPNGLRLCLRGPGHDPRCKRLHLEEWFNIPEVLFLYSSMVLSDRA